MSARSASAGLIPAFRRQGCAYHAKAFCRWGGLVVAPALDREAFRASGGTVSRINPNAWQVNVFGFRFPEMATLPLAKFAARQFAIGLMHATTPEELAKFARFMGAEVTS